MNKYISEKEFADFQSNFHILINTFNHNITDIRNDVRSFKDKSEKKIDTMASDLSTMKDLMSDFKSIVSTNAKLLWMLFGIIITIIIGAAIA